MKKRLFFTMIFIAVIIVFLFFAFGFFKRKNGEKTGYITDVVSRQDLISEITSTGTLEAVGTVEVGTQISGVIQEIKVDFNSTVRQGETLAVLDSRGLRASLLESQASYDKSAIQLEQAKRELERIKQLYDQNLISSQEYDNQIDAVEIARTSFTLSQAQLYRTKINYDNAVITSPISGIVISRAVDEGQTVAASLNTPTLFTIASDLTDMQIEALIDETDIGVIREGQKVVFDVDAYPGDTFEGIVSQIRLQPELVQNVVKYIVIVKVHNPDMKLLPGMTANLTVITDSRKEVLTVINAAFLFSPPREMLDDFVNTLPDSMRSANTQARGLNPGNSSAGFSVIWIKEG
ncbi:efflux RND transporter periplasmic adaptor subunit, partial [candidate division WOR-3 bacterium]|nr:efflux RND transporter periplasmic adaptor subunit [candidate division WOR-3 bacterium]